MNVVAGFFYTLKVARMADFGAYLDDGAKGILLPKRFMPVATSVGDEINVFVYHDGEDRLIATTQRPLAAVGDISLLACVAINDQGAFLNNGLMKDLFVHKNKQINGMRVNGHYLVKVYTDEQTGRMAATEKFDHELSNEQLTVTEKQTVQLTVYRRTDIGYTCIINNLHTGVLHFNEIYRKIAVGDKFEGFIKKIHEETPDKNERYKIDVAAGKPGYQRVEGEADKIIRLLKENGGFLPYHDKSDPEAIYDFFAMSKKTFKMTTGNLFKNRIISFEKNGIRLMA
jgi:uncharacterized protein